MADAEILFETMGRVALIRLNRPQQLNALTYRMLADIRRLVGEAEKDPEVTAIAFVGEGRGFCSGLDAEVLRQTTAAGESRPTERAEIARPERPDPPGMFSYLPFVSKPVISAVNGVAAGGGFILAMMSDLRFGSEAASFTTVFSKRGLIAEHGASWVLPRLVGPSRAMDLLWSSRRVTADEALRIGLLDRVTAQDALLETIVAYVDDLAAQISPSAIAVMKSQVWRHLSEPLLPALADADRLTQAQLKHPDAYEGAMALIERRAPNFQPWTGVDA
ncbi:MAG TPA: enoyl-CoA hydratase-related protein [Caulobacteraceae bacterium]|nr:enoyl-CoA hydratase-related protein [Caulobacteraceae bacterium]